MKINLLNYEAYAIDYVEGKLDPATHQEMQEFLITHPRIQQELKELAAFELPILSTISYTDKDSLYKTSRKFYLPIFAIAASLLLLVTLGYQFLYNNHSTNDMKSSIRVVEDPINQKNSDPIAINEQMVAEQTIPEIEKTERLLEQVETISQPQKNQSVKEYTPLKTAEEKLAVEFITVPDELEGDTEEKAIYPDKAVAVVEQEVDLKPEVIAQIPPMTFNPITNKVVVETADLAVYELSELTTDRKVAEVKKGRFLDGLAQPESFEKEDFKSLKKAMVPEAFGNLFSKKTR